MRKSKSQINRQRFLIYAAGFVFGLYLSVVYAPFLHGTVMDWLMHLREVKKTDYFHLTLNQHSLTVAGAFTGIYIICVMIYHLTRKNYRFGEEHGSAKWGDPQKICRKYRQPETREPYHNRKKGETV